ncbi:MAG: Gfo/Idh/MocA family oxidoreductase [Acidobacteria bacterium]|nr:Gfo/Idh/MocA family oxidoreductase [Acidobacteriota bacterium]
MIGHRFMGRAHSNAWRQVARFFETPFEPVLKVVCGRDPQEVERAANELGWEEASVSWRETVARPDIDVVDVCTPGDTHADIAVAAALSGKHVLCEKPLANTVAEAQRMLAAVTATGVTHMVCHNYRRVPAVALAKRLIEEGRLGRLYHFRGVYLQDWIVDPEFPRVWRLEKSKAGSGALGDIASHSIDLARYLVGEIEEVAGHLETFIKERPLPGSEEMAPVDVDDAVLSLLKFEGGAVGTIEATRFALGRKNYNSFEVNGSRGSLAFNLERMNELELYVEEGPESGFRTVQVTDASHPYMKAWWPPGHIIGYEHTFTHTVHDFLLAIDEGRIPSPSFEDGIRNQKVLDAVERAAQSRSWEKV